MPKRNETKVSEVKLEQVKELKNKMNTSRTVLIASTKSLPSSQFHEIKKSLRSRAEIKVAKKSLVIRAIESSKREGIKGLKAQVGADIALFFSELDPFELSGLLTENQSPARAKAGELAPEDIIIEPGPTNLVPGPAISELSGVGLKVTVENGKLAIKQGATVTKKGELIKPNVAGVLAKLGIMPMKVGFEPIAAYDFASDKVYIEIRIDKKLAYEELKTAISKALGFAINFKYFTKETMTYFFAKANAEEKAIQKLIEKSGGQL